MVVAYKTIQNPAQGEYKEKGSRFIAYAFPVKTEAECLQTLDAIRKEEHKARHHCFAYRVDVKEEIYRANDDGEPSGTAGRPILGQIDSYGLFNIMIIVVRYFGGTKLGASGLIRAYKTAAEEALTTATIIHKQVKDLYEVRFSYAHMGTLMDQIKSMEIEVLEQNFDKDARLLIAVSKNAGDRWQVQLKAKAAGVSGEEAETIQAIDGLSWKHLGIR